MLELNLRGCWLHDSEVCMLQAASPAEQRLPKSAALLGDRLKPGDKHGEQALLEAQPRETTLVALKAKTQVWQPGLSLRRPGTRLINNKLARSLGCVGRLCATRLLWML